jgi:LacI family transcriptional regulator
VGVVVGDLGNPFYMEAIEHLHRHLDRSGARAIVLTDEPDGPTTADVLLDGSMDGVILTTTLLESSLPGELARRGLPVVLLNRAIDDDDVDVCVSENVGGARAVAAEMVALGHRRVAAIFGPAQTSTGRDRERGFRDGLAQAGIKLPDRLVRRGSFSYETGHGGMSALLELPAAPTAVFCANDVIAIGALNAARALGADVPAQVSVFGFDDIAMASWDLFGLSTVRQDLAEMAGTAAALLFHRIAERERPTRRVVVPTKLKRRTTHGPPAR